VSWNLITDDWRLKLLALGLAILMLGAVAFAQNPPTTGNLTVGLNYTFGGANVILLNPPTRINVSYSGLADAIKECLAVRSEKGLPLTVSIREIEVPV